MLSHTNIDRQDSQQVSNAPFTFTSTLKLQESILPTGSFISLKVYVEEDYKVPFRFHSIRPDGKLVICDAVGTPVITWQTFAATRERLNERPYVSSLLYNMNGVIAGHVSCTHTAIAVIRNVVESITVPYLLDAGAFVLIPQCHVAMLKGQCRAIRQIDDNSSRDTTGDLELSFGTTDDCLYATENDKIILAMVNTEDKTMKMLTPNGLCNLVVNGNTHGVIGKSIIIKSKLESNLRVTKGNGRLLLKGVQSA